MSVLQPISFGLVHQVGPGSGAKGYGSYQADNTATMRPYQQQSASPIGRGYPITVISGDPTFFTPDVKEDPIVTLLKMLVNQGKKVVAEKEPDAGFRNNLPVFPPEGPAGDPQPAGGRALGAVPTGDRPNAGGDVKNESRALVRVTPETRILDSVVERLSSMVGATAAGAAAAAGSFGMVSNNPSLTYDAFIRQLEEAFADYVPVGVSEGIIQGTRYVSDLLLSAQRSQEDMVRLGERAVSDYVIRPLQQHANRGLQILINQAAAQYANYGSVDTGIIANIVEQISNNPTTSRGVTVAQGVLFALTALLNPAGLRRAMLGLRQNPTRRILYNARIRGG